LEKIIIQLKRRRTDENYISIDIEIIEDRLINRSWMSSKLAEEKENKKYL